MKTTKEHLKWYRLGYKEMQTVIFHTQQKIEFPDVECRNAYVNGMSEAIWEKSYKWNVKKR